ncbi:hypothetical protein RFI_13133 [Reticulomyxa filosa]|uniref:N-acetyltransferase domain-containing protein n=1 Tax=Reticulomyxa filosa TaxID=46433 RepID=X6NDP9_RETFI|nr:hypothetical protein RFI_13133 [Reticulomyxa filosa]|eukprot:ETO24023.1 hypothetical protein RFI_13133 [Reticulomyxa filosa]
MTAFDILSEILDFLEKKTRPRLQIGDIKKFPDSWQQAADLLHSEWPELFPKSLPSKVRESITSSEEFPQRVIVVENNDNGNFQVIGHVKITKGNDLSHGIAVNVWDVLIDKQRRNQGIGSLLMKHVEKGNHFF